jgi:hypothetical protein
MVVHCTSNDASPTNECLFAMRRTDGVGLHFCSDQTTVLQCLESWYGTGHVGSAQGNEFGISWEFVGLISWSTDYWKHCIDRAAASMRLPMQKYGIPYHWLSDAELRAGTAKGLVTHEQCSRVLGGSNHNDPGPNFPKQYLIDALNGASGMATYNDQQTAAMAFLLDAFQAVGTGDDGKAVPFTAAMKRIEAKLDVLLNKVELSDEDLAQIAQAAREGAHEGAEEGASGATTDEVRQIVDEELDEQSRAGADTDT